MSYEIDQGHDEGNHLAGADLRTHQYKFCNLNSSGLWVLNAVAGARCDGVLQNKPNTNEPARIRKEGVTKVVASAAIAVAAQVAAAADGRARTAVTGDTIMGKARTAAAGAGEVISVALDIGGVV